MWWCCQGVVLILIWRLVPVPPITNGWYWHSLQGGQAQTLYISTSVRREDRGQSSSQGLADTEIQNSVGNCSACTLSCSPSTTDKDTLVLVPRLYNNPLPVECVECCTYCDILCCDLPRQICTVCYNSYNLSFKMGLCWKGGR